MSNQSGPALLLILDGWGYREQEQDNAIALADTPVWDTLWRDCPHTLIHTSGLKVGLPEGQMGNSEVGHMNLGAGRVVYQNLTRINKDIAEGGFFKNSALSAVVDKVIENGKALHVIGLLSPGGIHSHEDQIAAMLDLACRRGCRRIYLHGILDGRDTPPRSAAQSLEKLQKTFADLDCGAIASLCGRFYAMDRDNRWDRVAKAFKMMTHGDAEFHFGDPFDALQAAYDRGENDEFVQSSVIHPDGQDPVTIKDGDGVVFMNFRADRARELTRAFVEEDFQGFDRGRVPTLCDFVMLTQYAKDIPANCAYPPENLKNVLGDYLAKLGKTQLRIAETEKYAHVTFFFSGGREQEFSGEQRVLIPSPQVSTYDEKPEMSVFEVTEELVKSIRERKYDVIICNFANGDMVGHTGVLEAAIKAAEAIDQCLGKIVAAIREVAGHCLITADHGNAEMMRDEVSGQPLTSHTSGPVPLLYVGKQSLSLQSGGALADISPTLLNLMGLTQPEEMTGHSLISEP